MNSRRWRARRWWRLATVAVTVAASFGAAQPVEAQTIEQFVVQRRLEMGQARASHQAALAAFNVLDRQFSQALDEVRAARRSGDNARLERAYALAQDRSVPHRAQEARLTEAAAALVRARLALIDALAGRMEELVRNMDAVGSGEQRARLNVLFMDHQRELQGLESEAADTFRIDPVVLPEIAFDPRDGPDELSAKAELLERRAADADSVIVDTDRRIQDLNRRVRIERQGRDFLAGAERFDDTRVPVVAARPTPGQRPASDSTVAGARPQTLEERIEALTQYRVQMEAYRDELRVRARQFRLRVGSVA